MALRGRGVVLLEAGNSLGAETSARNSEVIHAGLYYPPGSLKANLCVTGKALLYDYLGEPTYLCMPLFFVVKAIAIACAPPLCPLCSEAIHSARAPGKDPGGIWRRAAGDAAARESNCRSKWRA